MVETLDTSRDREMNGDPVAKVPAEANARHEAGEEVGGPDPRISQSRFNENQGHALALADCKIRRLFGISFKLAQRRR